MLRDQRCAGRNFLDARKHRMRRAGIPKREILRQCLFIKLSVYAWDGEDRFSFGREHQRALSCAIVDRLDAERIASDDQTALLTIPQRQPEHAFQLVEKTIALLFVEMH